MLAAVAVILGFFSIEYGQFIRIGFSSIPNGIIDYLFGPVVGGIFHGALDIIKYMMKPTGPFCPQLTLVVILAGILYGMEAIPAAWLETLRGKDIIEDCLF